jgi:hypothetical protein
MLIKAFENVDAYTMMSLSDVITVASNTFKEMVFDLASKVSPILVSYFLQTSAQDQINSMFSLLGMITKSHEFREHCCGN